MQLLSVKERDPSRLLMEKSFHEQLLQGTCKEGNSACIARYHAVSPKPANTLDHWVGAVADPPCSTILLKPAAWQHAAGSAFMLSSTDAPFVPVVPQAAGATKYPSHGLVITASALCLHCHHVYRLAVVPRIAHTRAPLALRSAGSLHSRCMGWTLHPVQPLHVLHALDLVLLG